METVNHQQKLEELLKPTKKEVIDFGIRSQVHLLKKDPNYQYSAYKQLSYTKEHIYG